MSLSVRPDAGKARDTGIFALVLQVHQDHIRVAK
jgi:hypothetical protein